MKHIEFSLNYKKGCTNQPECKGTLTLEMFLFKPFQYISNIF